MPVKILYVEDDPDDFLLLDQTLRHSGRTDFELVHAATPEAARECCRHQCLDLLLVDYSLQSETGVELMNWLHRHGLRVPMILFSAASQIDFDQAGDLLNSPLVSFIGKRDLDTSNVWQVLDHSLSMPVRTLVVEDTLEDCQVISAALEQSTRLAAQVRTARSLQSARIALEGGNFDLFVVDYLLARESGIALIRELLSNDPLAPVVLVSKYDIGEDDLHVSKLLREAKVCFLPKVALTTESLSNAANRSRCRVLF